MAKGNMLQGMARGKVGDVVFSRLNGEQVSRVRNRHPQNPRTEAQLYQRAIMATVMQAYSAGKAIFDHSFEGEKVGAGCQRAFMSRNAKILRSTISADLNLNRTAENCKGKVVGPGTQSPVGFAGMLVSNGNYDQSAFTFTAQDTERESAAKWYLPAALDAETCAAYAERVGLLDGDFYTFVGFVYDSFFSDTVFTVQGVTPDSGAEQMKEAFFYVRLGVKSSFVASTDPIADKKISDLFEVDAVSPYVQVSDILAKVFDKALTLEDIAKIDENPSRGWIALIRSRKDLDVRSTSQLVWGGEQGYDGITSNFALLAWQQGTEAVGNSRLILEGGGF